MAIKKDRKYSLDHVSNAFLGLRSTGLFAPLSYWRSNEDPGVGDFDTFIKVIDFAKKTDQSIIQLLPLNLPSADNCPYAIASNYIFDPVYIGIKSLFEFVGKPSDYSKAKIIYDSKSREFSKLRTDSKSTNDETRKIKYEILKSVFDIFKKEELKNNCDITEIISWKKYEKKDITLKARFLNYCLDNKSWLFDHVLFFILTREYNEDDFRKWPENIAKRDDVIIQSLKTKYKNEILFESFLQWILTEQLTGILQYAKSDDKPVDIMLDQPFAFGNADVWINIKAFHMNPKTLKKDFTQGVPPHRLDIPQHWQFTLLNFNKPYAKKLLINRIEFLLQFCTLLRIDHLLGYYQIYYLSEDIGWKMTLEKMKIWNEINSLIKSESGIKEKREKVYSLIVKGLKNKLPVDICSKVFDREGNLRYGNVILACRKNFPDNDYDKNITGWYEVNSTEFSRKLLYTLLSHNNYGEDYLTKIIQDENYFLKADDSIRIGFFNPGLGEEIISEFTQLAHNQGKELIFENLGLVPCKVSQSIKELGVSEFKPLYFGFQYFKGDHNDYWFDNISSRDYCSFSIHDTVTIEGWWTGKGYWAEKKYYFTDSGQKTSLVNWLITKNYLSSYEKTDLEELTYEMQRALLGSVSDSNASMTVFMMPDIFKSGEEGIINIPGSRGFWTARSPVYIEDLIYVSDGKSISEKQKAYDAVKLIIHLSSFKKRNSIKTQLEIFSNSAPCVIKTNPICGQGFKQIRFLNESFLIDAVIYGMIDNVIVLLNDCDVFNMKKIIVKNRLPDNLNIYRVYIPVTKNLVRTNSFKILINEKAKTDYGYLIGLPLKTDSNPLSDNYGKVVL